MGFQSAVLCFEQVAAQPGRRVDLRLLPRHLPGRTTHVQKQSHPAAASSSTTTTTTTTKTSTEAGRSCWFCHCCHCCRWPRLLLVASGAVAAVLQPKAKAARACSRIAEIFSAYEESTESQPSSRLQPAGFNSRARGAEAAGRYRWSRLALRSCATSHRLGLNFDPRRLHPLLRHLPTASRMPPPQTAPAATNGRALRSSCQKTVGGGEGGSAGKRQEVERDGAAGMVVVRRCQRQTASSPSSSVTRCSSCCF